MSEVVFSIVDVFAERKYAGNQLAVFRNVSALTSEEMQLLARETNFSETTFVLDDKPTVRIFTPKAEIPFAGHPTLGTAAVLMGDRREVTLHLKVGPIRVERQGDLYWMRQNAPTFGKRVEAAEIAPMLGLDASDLAGPAEEVSTGLPHLIVPIRSLESLRRARVDLERYDKLIARLDAKCIFPFAVGASHPSNHLTVRQFAPLYDILEDPATGSGNGALAAYLSKHRVLGSDVVDARSEQGANLGRPSVLHLKARPGARGIEVDVGGMVHRVAEGRLVR